MPRPHQQPEEDDANSQQRKHGESGCRRDHQAMGFEGRGRGSQWAHTPGNRDHLCRVPDCAGKDPENRQEKCQRAERADPQRNPDADRSCRSPNRQVGNEPVELTVGAGPVEHFEPLLELIRTQPSLCRRVAQPLCRLFSIRI